MGAFDSKHFASSRPFASRIDAFEPLPQSSPDVPVLPGWMAPADDEAAAIARLPGWWRRKWAMLAAVAAALVVAALWMRGSAKPTSYLAVPIDRGDVVRMTTASGMVNPIETVQIGSYVSGRIQDLSCDYNSKVVKGQQCAKIDPRSYEAAVRQAAAAVATARAQLAKDEANLAYMEAVFARNRTLWDRGAVSHDAAENALNTFRQAQAQADLDRTLIEQREAELSAARVNLDYTDIISPVDGTVVSRNVAIGQTVASSFQTPTLFLIATDLMHMQIDANVTEAAIGEVREGQKATFTVEAFPDRTFTGVVTQVRQAPISVQNVISYDVVIDTDNAELLLRPGMTATTHIVVAERTDVLRVPESALRFAPAAERPNAGQGKQRTVFVLRHGHLVPVSLAAGLADDNFVEVTAGAFEPDDRVVVARDAASRLPAAAQIAVQP